MASSIVRLSLKSVGLPGPARDPISYASKQGTQGPLSQHKVWCTNTLHRVTASGGEFEGRGAREGQAQQEAAAGGGPGERNSSWGARCLSAAASTLPGRIVTTSAPVCRM